MMGFQSSLALPVIFSISQQNHSRTGRHEVWLPGALSYPGIVRF
jgi:hypothetical protein